MTQTITAMFDDYNLATDAVGRLKVLGIPDQDISIVGGNQDMRTGTSTVTGDGAASSADDSASGAGAGATAGAVLGGGAGILAGIGILAIPGLGPVVAAGWLASMLTGAVAGGAAGGIIGALTGAGMSEEEAHTYAEGVRRGGTIVTARVEDRLVEKVCNILDADGTVDVQERSDTWRSEGWRNPVDKPVERSTAQATPPATAASIGTASATQATQSQPGTIPIVEEQLNVGKRRVETGRVRVHARPVEQEVEQPIHLRDERVRVEHIPVEGQSLAPGAMQERVIEETEIREEPVVSKEGRVVEQVRVTKEADDRTETVRDTVKRTEVEVEDTRGEKSGTATETTPKVPKRGA